MSNEQHIPVHIHIPCGLRYCDTALTNPPYRIKLELAAERPSLECESAKGKHPVLVSTNPAAGHNKKATPTGPSTKSDLVSTDNLVSVEEWLGQLNDSKTLRVNCSI